jgi:DNA-binding NarL/FixJ family response regulator
MKKTRIILIDDHQLVRDGIKALLTGIPDISIVGEASGSEELFDKMETLKPDLLIMDISLPGLSGIEITRKVSSEYPDVQVLILSMYTNEEFIINALNAGARGYLPKNTSREELVSAIHSLVKGEEFYGESISRIMLKSYVKQATTADREKKDPSVPLTIREIEILKLYVEGLINKEISDRLDISIRTVETHKNHIMRKLGLKSTVELVKYAIRNKIAEI